MRLSTFFQKTDGGLIPSAVARYDEVMVYGAGILLAAILALLSLLHVYWALGGRWGSDVAVPAVDDKRVFNPSPIATGIVALALLTAALIVLGRLNLWGIFLPKFIFHGGAWALTLIFFLRVLGEFRWVGFFKRVRDTRFAYWDTWLFSPLCLLIGMLAFIVAYNPV